MWRTFFPFTDMIPDRMHSWETQAQSSKQQNVHISMMPTDDVMDIKTVYRLRSLLINQDINKNLVSFCQLGKQQNYLAELIKKIVFICYII